MDASILVVGVLALKDKSEFQLPIHCQKKRLTTVITVTFFLSAYIAKFDLDLSLASKTEKEKQM